MYEDPEGHGLFNRYRNASIDTWRNAMLDAVQPYDTRFPKFSHIAKLGSANLRDGIIEAFKLYKIARPHMDGCVGDDKAYLDFGCGVGRILRCFMRDFPAANMTGADVTAEFIDICRDNFGDRFNFLNIAPRPPIDMPDNSVDVITAYSVFSHFSAVQATRWLDEFYRIARPGAIVALTTYSRAHINFIYDAPPDTVPPNKAAQKEELNEYGGRSEAFRMFGLGEMIYFQKGAAFGKHDYGNAYVGEEFVRRVWGRQFEILEIKDEYKELEQMAVIMRKPE